MNTVIINKSNLLHNYKVIRRLAKQSKVCAVVKANAYGHDMEIVSDVLKDCVDYFAVSTIEEGMDLRRFGITNNILILGYILPDQAKFAIDYDLEICIGNEEQLNSIISIAKAKKKMIKFHLKKNSGLSRYGYNDSKELIVMLDIIERNLKFLKFVGFFTHFVITENDCEENIRRQNESFEMDVAVVHGRGFYPLIHAAASTTLFLTKKYQYDMVRVGMAFYGFCGFDEKLKKVLTVKSMVVTTRKISNQQTIGYGGDIRPPKNLRVAVVPVGYGYGIPSKLSEKSFVLINGERCAIIGHMSMDCMYVDVTALKDKVVVGSEVVFIGKQKKEEITATDHAHSLGIYSCEILTHLNIRRFEKKIRG